jgi:hypothetical protein
MSNEAINEIPAEVQARLTSWKRGRQINGTTAHNLLGLLGILGSLVALTGLPGFWTKAATIVTGFALAAMSLWNPRHEYLKFAMAWRVLDAAARRYRFGLIPFDELLTALELGETIIEEADSLLGGSSVEILQRSLNHSRALRSSNPASRPRKFKKASRTPVSAKPVPPPEPPDGT